MSEIKFAVISVADVVVERISDGAIIEHGVNTRLKGTTKPGAICLSEDAHAA